MKLFAKSAEEKKPANAGFQSHCWQDVIQFMHYSYWIG